MYFILFKKYRNVLPEKKLTFFHIFMFYQLTQISILYNILNINAAVAQLVERRTENPYVVGSIPTCGTKASYESKELFYFNSSFFFLSSKNSYLIIEEL